MVYYRAKNTTTIYTKNKVCMLGGLYGAYYSLVISRYQNFPQVTKIDFSTSLVTTTI